MVSVPGQGQLCCHWSSRRSAERKAGCTTKQRQALPHSFSRYKLTGTSKTSELDKVYMHHLAGRLRMYIYTTLKTWQINARGQRLLIEMPKGACPEKSNEKKKSAYKSSDLYPQKVADGSMVLDFYRLRRVLQNFLASRIDPTEEFVGNTNRR